MPKSGYNPHNSTQLGMAYLRKYRRFLAVGCSHGALIDRDAAAAVLKFKRAWKPDVAIHLGDVGDYAAFRGGAKGAKDEAEALGPDIAAGKQFIRQFRPTHVLIGNHDERIWRLSTHHNAVIALAASAARNEFLTACEKAKVKVLVDHYDINRSWIELGDTKFLHGWMYNENAMRDHAEHFGKCVIAHLHVAGIGNARRSDHATCHCVGTLADIPMMDYAKTRRSTARWSHGFCYGEYSEKECHVYLSAAPQNQAGVWRLPL